MGLNAFLIFMSSYKGLGPQKQIWPIRMKLSKPFHRQLFHYAENLFYELISNINRLNCPTQVCRTKIRPYTCCVISLAQYIINKKYTPYRFVESFIQNLPVSETHFIIRCFSKWFNLFRIAIEIFKRTQCNIVPCFHDLCHFWRLYMESSTLLLHVYSYIFNYTYIFFCLTIGKTNRSECRTRVRISWKPLLSHSVETWLIEVPPVCLGWKPVSRRRVILNRASDSIIAPT